MGLANLIGQMVAQSMTGPAQTRMRAGAGQAGPGVEGLLGALFGGAAEGGGGVAGIDGMGSLRRGAGAPSGGLGDLLGGMLGGAQAPAARRGAGGLGDLLGAALGGGSGRGGGDLADMLGAALGGGSAQRMAPPGAPRDGGLGDMLGALLGGGGRTAGGSAMAVLAGLAIQALRSSASASAAAPVAPVAPQEAAALVDVQAERLVLKAMIAAMKADGRIDADETAKLKAEAGRDGIDADEAAFLEAELARPIDLAGLADHARTPAAAAQVYAASIVAISIDTEAERAYLRALAQALGLDAGTVAHLHRMTGAPPA